MNKPMDLERAWFVYKCHHNNRNCYCSVVHEHCCHDNIYDNKWCKEAKEAEKIIENFMNNYTHKK